MVWFFDGLLPKRYDSQESFGLLAAVHVCT